jgi:hypothetical protein
LGASLRVSRADKVILALAMPQGMTSSSVKPTL